MSTGFGVREGKWYKHQLRLARDIYKQVIHQLFLKVQKLLISLKTIRKPPLAEAQDTVKNNFQYGGRNSFTLQCDTWLWYDMPSNSSKSSAILEFYFLFRFRQYHRSRRVILHQSAKFYPNRTAHGRKKWHHVDFQDGGDWILGVQQWVLWKAHVGLHTGRQ